MKIKEFIKKQRFTLMIVPNSGKSTRQLRFNFVVLYVLLGLILAVNLFLAVSMIYNASRANALDTHNRDLQISLKIETDKISNLENIVNSSTKQIAALKSSLEESANLTEERLKYIQDTEKALSELVTLFNEQTNSDLQPAVSRGADRTISGRNEDEILKIARSLSAEDEITSELLSKQETLKSLKLDLENQLDYLDARPDLFPTVGSITSGYGYRQDPITGVTSMHNGIDIANYTGTEVYAAGSGYVFYSGYTPGYGYVVMIDHGYGYNSVYAHLSELFVKEKDTVSKGDIIALMGATGYATGSHLHFEIRYYDTPFDPLTMLNQQ